MPDAKRVLELTGRDEPGFTRISEQEACIVRLMASGYGPDQIAAELRMSSSRVCCILQQLATRLEATDSESRAAEVDRR